MGYMLPKLLNVNGWQNLFENKYPGFMLEKHEVKGYRLYLDLVPTDYPICPRCLKKCEKIHSCQDRMVKDFPMFSGMEQYVRFKIRRVRCDCGCRQNEAISWIEPRGRLSSELIHAIQCFLRCQMPTEDISRLLNVSWDTIRTYDKLQLKELFDEIDLSHVRHLAVDEFSLQKGHRYATVIMDIENRQVLWVGKGKTKASIQPFFDLLSQQGYAQQIESVSCDMNAAYPSLFQENLPNATIVYDLFHVIKNFTEVLAKARQKCVEAIKEAGSNETGKENRNNKENQAGKEKIHELKNAEWILAKRPDDLTASGKQRLDRLINDNRLLAALYPLVGALREVWTTKLPELAAQRVEWIRSVLLEINTQYEFKPAKQFAGMLLRRIDGIVHAGRLGFSTNRLEGANNKIKTIRRTAYGYRDLEYFFLKIKSVLPGIRFSPWDFAEKGVAFLKKLCWFTPFHVKT